MATRDQRHTFIPSSSVPSKETPPVAPRGAWMRWTTSSRRSAPRCPGRRSRRISSPRTTGGVGCVEGRFAKARFLILDQQSGHANLRQAAAEVAGQDCFQRPAVSRRAHDPRGENHLCLQHRASGLQPRPDDFPVGPSWSATRGGGHNRVAMRPWLPTVEVGRRASSGDRDSGAPADTGRRPSQAMRR